jgi:hypothetical protein
VPPESPSGRRRWQRKAALGFREIGPNDYCYDCSKTNCSTDDVRGVVRA